MVKSNSTHKRAQIDQLKANMSIIAYTGFNQLYRPMDDTVCKWVKLNFKGSMVRVNRNGEKLELMINQLKIGDHLNRIYKFPSNLKKITTVNDRLVQELKLRGFVEFIVHTFGQPKSSKQIRREEAIQQTEIFVNQVKENIRVRDDATYAIEDMMDNTRQGKTDTRDIMNFVKNIVKTSSTGAMSAITSLKKSDQTYAHCIDVGAIFQTVYQKLLKKTKKQSVFENEEQALNASILHDFGKSKIPKDILDSTELFARDSSEMKIIRSHPKFGAELLSKMSMPDAVINMAHFHHVKLDVGVNSSYPEDGIYKNVNMETRLISIIDIYQSLVGKRNYKKSWPPPAAMRYIDQLAGIEFDLEIWEAFEQIMGIYPKGSLVELSDNSQAFVVSVPQTDLKKPQVIVVRDEDGHSLEHNSMIDLLEEQDLSIVKELDSDEIFGEAAIDVFTNLQIS